MWSPPVRAAARAGPTLDARHGPAEVPPPEDHAILNQAFLIQTAASALAVGVLVGLSAWAKLARPMPPLTEARARTLLAEEFPTRAVETLWIAADGCGALARSGASALVLCQVGDGYVARSLPWAQALASTFRDGVLRLDLTDVAAPRARLAFDTWPPMGGNATSPTRHDSPGAA